MADILKPGSVNFPELDSTDKSLENDSGHQRFHVPPIPTWRLIALSIGLCTGLFLAMLDSTIVATALYTIGTDFKSLTSITWVALAYTLSYLGCVVISARMGDIIGRRNAYTSAFIIFFAFSIGCGFCQSQNALIACRALQGVGGSGLYSLSIIIFPEITPHHLTKWLGSIVGAVVAVSGVLGPVLGGLITHYTTWRWIFWINPLIGILPLIMFWFAWPKTDQIRHAERKSLRQLDFVSCMLLIAASVLVVFSFQESGIRTNSWRTATFLAPLIIGCLCWLLLFAWEWTVDRLWPNILSMVPLRLIKRRVYLAGTLSALLTGFPYFVIVFSLPLRFQVVNQKSPISAGLGILPMVGSTAYVFYCCTSEPWFCESIHANGTLVSSVGSMVAGIVTGKKNRTFLVLVAASCLMVIGTACMSTLTDTIEVEAKVYGFQVFVGLGFGLTVATSSILATIECELKDHAVAQGIVAQVRVLGGSIGIAASTAILGIVEYNQLRGIVTNSQLASLRDSEKTFTTSQLQAVRKAYSDAFNEDMRVCAIVAGICVLLTLGTFQRNPLDIQARREQQVVEEDKRLRDLQEK